MSKGSNFFVFKTFGIAALAIGCVLFGNEYGKGNLRISEAAEASWQR